MKPNGKLKFRHKLVYVAVASCFTVLPAYANPTGATVASGQVGFAAQGSTLNITNSPNAIINWQQFSINPGEITRFIQQSASSAVLNRVVGQNPSQILGSLLSNGRVFLINPNGIVFGQGATIDVAGLVASTLQMSNGDFLAGKLKFNNGVGAGSIDNQGSITTPAGGNVYLIAPDIKNSGLITSPQGEILLAAGHTVNLMDTANPDVQVTLNAPPTTAVNLGTLMAQSGKIGIYGALLDQQGTINADTAIQGANGQIMLRASQDITLEPGSITTASGTSIGVKDGGSIRIVADGTLNMRSGSEVHVDGGSGGGNGGFLELSGKGSIALNGTYTGNAKAAGYQGGDLLLDPLNINICSGSGCSALGTGTVSASSGSASSTLYLSPNMTGGGWTNVSLAATNDITIAASIANGNVPAGGSLTMTAGNHIYLNPYRSIGSTSSPFAHDLTLRTLNPNSQILIEGNIVLGNNTLTLSAPTGVNGGDIGIGSQYSFSALTVSTQGNMNVTGRDFFVIDGGEAAPTSVSAAGTLTLGTAAAPLTHVYVGRGVSGSGSTGSGSYSVHSPVTVEGGSVVVNAGSLTVAAAAANSRYFASSGNANASAALVANSTDITLNLSGGLNVYGGVVRASGSSSSSISRAADATIYAANNLNINLGSGAVMDVRGGVADVYATSGWSASATARGVVRAGATVSVTTAGAGGISLQQGTATASGSGSTSTNVAARMEASPHTINLTFQGLSAGGYFVNGVEGVISTGSTAFDSGFFTGGVPAVLNSTMFTTYGVVPTGILNSTTSAINNSTILQGVVQSIVLDSTGGQEKDDDKKPMCT